ncbi:hypothetical protein T4D_4104 [Trichinella pseudospiralis]|uniref:Uncharacterized protein n=1 Tax=Trichinella pseudospiralis TaxID=6337 RepID=A0A0V1FH07_TRIPS|nr:hypothetical protein T4D_4104 [Trichinella pseudospiralis]
MKFSDRGRFDIHTKKHISLPYENCVYSYALKCRLKIDSSVVEIQITQYGFLADVGKSWRNKFQE